MRAVCFIALLVMVVSVACGQTLNPVGNNQLADKLFEAISKSDVARVKQLIKQGANPNATYANGWSTIFRALEMSEKKNGMAVLITLIKAGANVNAVQLDQGWTPLHQAVATQIGPVAAVELLIKHGAKLETQMPIGGTPLHIAAGWGRVDFAKILLDNRANIEARLKSGQEPASQGLPAGTPPEFRKEMERMDKEMEVHNRKAMEQMAGEPGYDKVGQTPLMAAVGSFPAHPAMVRFLLDRGANVNARDALGRTPLHEAAQNGSWQIMELLIQKGAKIDARTKNGLTPLHIAVRPNPFGGTVMPSVEILLKNGADPNARTKTGLGPLEMRERGVKALLDRVKADHVKDSEIQPYLVEIKKQTSAIKALLEKFGEKSKTRSRD